MDLSARGQTLLKMSTNVSHVQVGWFAIKLFLDRLWLWIVTNSIHTLDVACMSARAKLKVGDAGR